MSIRFIFIAAFLAFCLSGTAHAACSGGEKEGTMGFDMDGSGEYKYCNGTSYVSMKEGAAVGTCDKAGVMYYDESVSSLVWCDGSEIWRAATGFVVGGCGLLGVLLGGSAGALQFDTVTKRFYICNGAGWLPIL